MPSGAPPPRPCRRRSRRRLAGRLADAELLTHEPRPPDRGGAAPPGTPGPNRSRWCTTGVPVALDADGRIEQATLLVAATEAELLHDATCRTAVRGAPASTCGGQSRRPTPSGTDATRHGHRRRRRSSRHRRSLTGRPGHTIVAAAVPMLTTAPAATHEVEVGARRRRPDPPPIPRRAAGHLIAAASAAAASARPRARSRRRRRRRLRSRRLSRRSAGAPGAAAGAHPVGDRRRARRRRRSETAMTGRPSRRASASATIRATSEPTYGARSVLLITSRSARATPGPPLRGTSSPPAVSSTKIWTSTRPRLKIAVRLSPPDSTSVRSTGSVLGLERSRRRRGWRRCRRGSRCAGSSRSRRRRCGRSAARRPHAARRRPRS